MSDAPAESGVPSGLVLHATTISLDDRALMITGRSGCGKSSLAMQCIGLGATLVSDDRTVLQRRGEALFAAAPETIEGLIEVRGLGLLRLPFARDVAVAGAVALDEPETERLPPMRTLGVLGVELPLYRAIEGSHFAAALLRCLCGARELSFPLSGPAQ